MQSSNTYLTKEQKQRLIDLLEQSSKVYENRAKETDSYVDKTGYGQQINKNDELVIKLMGS